MKIVVGHLYPEYLNIYADRGNIAVLARRAAWRGHELEVRRSRRPTRSSPARTTSSTSAAARTASRRSSRTTSRASATRLLGRAAGGAAVLAVCGGYQLLGRFYRVGDGERAPGRRAVPAAHGRRRAPDDRRRPARLRARARRAAHARRLREPRRPDVPRRGRGAARPRRRRLRERRRERLRGLPRRAGRRHATSTGRSCRATRGSRTGCSRRRSPTARARSRRAFDALEDELEREAHAVSAGRARARGGPLLKGRPERAEVDDRVARAPAAQEALDRRVEDDPVQLVDRKSRCPRTAASFEVTCSSERPERSPAKTMWTTCFAAKLPSGEIESAIATGPSSGSSSSIPTSSKSSRWSASTRLSPPLTPPPGSSQYSLPGFSCRQSRMRPSQRRSAETRIRGSIRTRSRTRARRARSPGSSSTSTRRDVGHREDDELRDPHARLDDERLAVGVEQVDAQLAAVAGVDQAGRVHDRDPVLAPRARARLDVAGVALRDRDREPGRDDRALARPELDTLAGGEVDARRRPRTRAVGTARRGADAGSGARSHRPLVRLGVGDEERGEAAELARGRRACTSTPSRACPRAPRSARRARTARRASRPRRTARAAARARTGRRSARRCARRSSSSPSPV